VLPETTCGQGRGSSCPNSSVLVLPGAHGHVLVWVQNDGFVKAL